MQLMHCRIDFWIIAWMSIAGFACAITPSETRKGVDFKTEIRPILSNRCFACHGPDDEKVESGLRLDSLEAAVVPADSGLIAIIPGDVETSELLKRIASQDDSVRMPPPHFGQGLTAREIELVRRWIAEGAHYAKHWAYEPPQVPRMEPAISEWESRFPDWHGSTIDRWLLARLATKQWEPAPTATPQTLLRRLYLDLTGLPPTLEEQSAYLEDTSPLAYDNLVDRLLASPAYGEHWGRRWLDLARYADSAGYADDPARTIWAYRDWVIRAMNDNMPFDQFTLEQLAGDLLSNPSPETLVATAFHRNTLTNNEGGTNDEEFRNVAVIDRVNTTMAVWMGLTMGCAQCHNHKYDPISQKEYFQVFAVLNQSEDADRGDESPTYAWYSPDQRARRADIEKQLQDLGRQISQPDPALLAEQSAWESQLRTPLDWIPTQPSGVTTRSGDPSRVSAEGRVEIDSKAKHDRFIVEIPLPEGIHPNALTGIRIASQPDPALPAGGASHGDGNFVLTHVSASITHPNTSVARGQYVRIELPGKDRILSLAEVQVLSGAMNLATRGRATQSSEILGGAPQRAIDGNTSGNWLDQSTTHSAISENPWWELDLGSLHSVESIALWNRTDNGLQDRLSGAKLTLLDAERREVWQTVLTKGEAEHRWTLQSQWDWVPQLAAADHSQSGFPAAHAIDKDPKSGWAVGGSIDQPHALEIAGSLAKPYPDTQADSSAVAAPAVLRLELAFDSAHERLVLSRMSVSLTQDPRIANGLQIPTDVLALLRKDDRSQDDSQRVHQYYVGTIAPSRAAWRDQRNRLQSELDSLKPLTSVPVLRELAPDKRRETRIQLRGNYRVGGDVVEPGIPAVFLESNDSGDASSKTFTRLELAQWLVSRGNPLTARVIANRIWESLFGVGIVRSSEEFGSQGDLPTHPELLDRLAIDLMQGEWDLKRFLRSIVLSAAYRQSSAVDPKRFEEDPENSFVSRGPRFRVSAEQVRDMALASAGLLSNRFYGPPTRPPQPSMGLSAAFGSRTDWETSQGEDRFRRAVYTLWRRSNPYPSMAMFDAPNREVCVLKRDRTNTPLQALVTLNDPVFMEAAQGLARRVSIHELPTSSNRDRIVRIFQHALSREPHEAELAAVERLLQEATLELGQDRDRATKLATEPIGPLPKDADPIAMAAWTTLCNVVLNLDEFLMTP
jgi:hypothetical protein